MRAKRFFIHTVKESPTEAELISHRLMLRAGLVHKAAAVFIRGCRLVGGVVRKISTIVRQEMDAAGCAEVFMPAANPPNCGKNPALGGLWSGIITLQR